jgi:hypothetical protein
MASHSRVRAALDHQILEQIKQWPDLSSRFHVPMLKEFTDSN